MANIVFVPQIAPRSGDAFLVQKLHHFSCRWFASGGSSLSTATKQSVISSDVSERTFADCSVPFFRPRAASGAFFVLSKPTRLDLAPDRVFSIIFSPLPTSSSRVFRPMILSCRTEKTRIWGKSLRNRLASETTRNSLVGTLTNKMALRTERSLERFEIQVFAIGYRDHPPKQFRDKPRLP